MDDFFEGAIHSAERREARSPNRDKDVSSELKDDVASGVMTATLRGIVNFFFATDKD
ncbi:hypothetical protein D210916BOD24_13570 [Alteromonas sp. D210916BOD_24]